MCVCQGRQCSHHVPLQSAALLVVTPLPLPLPVRRGVPVSPTSPPRAPLRAHPHRQVSAELAAACSEGVDLVVLEGMGRAIETNLRAAFTADSLKLGMIKHPEVAQLLGGRLYDCVCKYDKGTTGNRE